MFRKEALISILDGYRRAGASPIRIQRVVNVVESMGDAGFSGDEIMAVFTAKEGGAKPKPKTKSRKAKNKAED